MNKYSAYPHRIPGGFGFWAMIQFCRDSHPTPFMDAGDKPKLFPTKGEAAEECLKHVVAFMNGKPIRGEKFEDGGSVKQAKFAAAEKIFKQGRAIEIGRRVGTA